MDITNGSMERPHAPIAKKVGGVVEKGVFKAYKNILYDQLRVDPYACCLVAPFTAISNYAGKEVGYDVILGAFKELKKTTFTPGVGDYLDNGVNMALKHYNAATGKSIKSKIVELSEASMITSLKAGSPIVTGIFYGKGFFMDEEDNGILNSPTIGGALGHAVSIVKLNNYDDTLIKYAENYEEKHKYNIILADFNMRRKMFFDTGFVFFGA